MRYNSKNITKSATGILLAVAFLVTANVQADIVRGTDQGKNLVPIFTYTYDNATQGVTIHDITDNADLANELEGFVRFHTTGGFDMEAMRVIDAISAYSSGKLDFIGISAAFTSNDGNYTADYLTGLKVNGNTVSAVEGQEQGNYFHGLYEALHSSNPLLKFAFPNGLDSYQFTLYGERAGEVPPPVTPEPATLMVLGLGLSGLGLAARRRKNKQV